MSNAKKNSRLENKTNHSNNYNSTSTKDLVDSTSENAYATDVIPDEVERRNGPGGN